MSNRRRVPLWHFLFDPSEMDHVCELVRAAVDEVASGEQSQLFEALQRCILSPLDAYIAEPPQRKRRGQAAGRDWLDEPSACLAHVEAAQRFYRRVWLLARLLENGAAGAAVSGADEAAGLRLAWLEFIAYGMGHVMYSDKPRDIEQRWAAAAQPRESTQRKRLARTAPGLLPPSPEAFADYYNQRQGEKLSAVVVGFSEAAGISERTAWRRHDRAKELNLLS